MSTEHAKFQWSGKDKPFLNSPCLTQCGHVTVGRYGGSIASGAYKNEDAALILSAPDGSWAFAALLDAHGSSESADLVLAKVAALESEIVRVICESSLWELSPLITRHFEAEDFRRACAAVRGETAILLCAQKGAYAWWLSVGDIPVYVFHPEFARLGQFALNQRMFFEWIGQVNTFSLPIPCYTTGIRQLRSGRNRILLTTDGLLECGARLYENSTALYDLFQMPLADAMKTALESVHRECGRDSATLIAWEVNIPESEEIAQPSA